MALEKRIVPTEHHQKLLETHKPGNIALFNSKSEAEAAAGANSWIAVRADASGNIVEKNGVVIDAVPPTGYTPSEWVQSPRTEKVYGLIAEQVMPEFPSE